MIDLTTQFVLITALNLISPNLQVVGFGAEFLCGRIAGLTVKQRNICQSAPDAVAAIGEGMRLGLAECQDQFRNSRWNCSTPSTSGGHTISVVGSRETAFLYAISSAGVTYAIAQACARGNITSCGCAPPTTLSMTTPQSHALTTAFTETKSNSHNSSFPSFFLPSSRRSRVNASPRISSSSEWNTVSGWRWGGCSADILFATKLARIFLDSREVERDGRSFMNLHNNKAGRKAVQSTLETQCKCHGLSGSCTLKTCWLKLASFKKIGALLMEKYKSADHVYALRSKVSTRSEHTDRKHHRKKGMELYVRSKEKRYKALVNGPQIQLDEVRHRRRSQEFAFLRATTKRKAPRIRPKHTSLVYLKESPNYCELDSLKAILGTKSRQCSRSQDAQLTRDKAEGSCEILCCGRGYSTHEFLKKWRCQCKFSWCCAVECQECQQLVEIYTCN